jgi:hypothetical protein
MGGHPFSVFHCVICVDAVDLTVDLSADENGQAIHEDCYVKHITSSRSNPPATMIGD